MRPTFINVGERTNVTGSPKFRKLIADGNYPEALSVARQQVEAGARKAVAQLGVGEAEAPKHLTADQRARRCLPTKATTRRASCVRFRASISVMDHSYIAW